MRQDIDWTTIIIEIDSELISEGVEPYKRPFAALLRIAQQYYPGSSFSLQDSPIANSVNDAYRQLYRPSDLEMPPMHVGAFMFRDVFFPIRIPMIFGAPQINPVNLLEDISEIQKRWLFTDKQTGLTFFDQFIDLMDFSYGLSDLENSGKVPDKTIEWWYLAKRQLEAAAATILGSFNKYAIVQNCCISTELLLKGSLFAQGVDENTLKSSKKGYGHNLENLATKNAENLSYIEGDLLLSVIKQLPNYVESRYEAKDFSRLDLGIFLMNTQFIGGEILRQFSERDVRTKLTSKSDDSWDLTHRSFPKI